MAKTRQTVKEEAPLELDKTLIVDGKAYNINAVHSDNADSAISSGTADIASQLQHSIVINKKTIDGTENTVSFNGLEEVEFDTVSAEGGKFSGPIRVPNVKDTANFENGEINSEAVLNYDDIVNTILTALINNSTTYAWDGTTLTPGTTEGTVNGLSLITGRLARLLDSSDSVTGEKTPGFAAYNYENKIFPAYLYLVTEGADGQGNLYYGTSKRSSILRIAATAGSLGYTDEELATRPSLFNYTKAAYIYDRFKELTSGTTVVAKAEVANEVSKLTTDNGTVTGQTLVNNIATLQDNIGKFTSGAATVAKATTAVSATTAASATKATQDSTGTQINTNYYRCASPFTTEVNTITISSSGPSGGNNGDIWIKY